MAKWSLLALFALGIGLIWLGLEPLLDLRRAQALGVAHGCIVNAAGTAPCIVDGVDIGPDLAARSVGSIAILLTVWWAALGAALAIGAVLGGVVLALRRPR